MSGDFSIFNSEYSSDDLLSLFVELDLFPLFIRRYIERKSCSAYVPSEDQQITHQRSFLSRENIQSSTDLLNWLDSNDVTEVQLSKQLYHSLQLKLFKSSKFDSLVDHLFLQSKSKLDQAMYSLIRCSQRAKANEIFTRLNEEEASFADLAAKYSEGFEQQVNGLIGPMELGRINSSIAERLRISKEGQVWEPFEEQQWWVILRLEKLIPARLDSEMKVRLVDVLYEDWIKKKVLSEMELASSSPLFSTLNSSESSSSKSSTGASFFQKVLHKVRKNS